MLDRRTFLGTMGLGAMGGTLAAPSFSWAQAAPRKRMAIVTTEWRYKSHAWHMGERFLVGYPNRGRWHQPPFDVVAAYVDQQPKNDLSRRRSQEFDFPIYPSIGEALRCGGKELAVDAVNVCYTQAGLDAATVEQAGPGGCKDGHGWFYDDPDAPSEIVLCRKSCEQVQAHPEGRVDVVFGCATYLK